MGFILALLTLIIMLSGALIYYEFDTYIEMEGRLISDNKNLVITSKIEGAIFSTTIYKNSHVSKNDPLLIVADTHLNQQIDLTLKALQAVSAAIDRASNQLINQPLVFSNFSQGNFEAINHQTAIFNQQTRIQQQKINEIQTTLNFTIDELSLHEHLERNGIFNQLQPHSLLRQISILTQEKRSVEEAYRHRLRQELASLVKSQEALQQTLNHKKEYLQAHHTLSSPIDGVVSEILINGLGTLVTVNQPLLVMSPTKEHIMAVLHVNSETLTLIENGQAVDITLSSKRFWKKVTISGIIQYIIVPESKTAEQLNQKHNIKLYISIEQNQPKNMSSVKKLMNNTNVNMKIYLNHFRPIDKILF